MVEEVEGIIITEKDYGDTSKILDILTKDRGIIGVISKGCKSMKSNLRSVSSKLTYGLFTIYYKKDKLSILSEVNVINSFSNIKKDIQSITFASFLLDLSTQVYKQNQVSDIYDLLIASLIKINDKFDPLVITNILELKYLEYLGVIPTLDGCNICGSKNVITLSSDKGGYLCNKCRINEPIISSKSLKLFRMYYYVDISKIEKLEVSNESKKEINEFLDSYYDRYTGLYLKSKSFLKKMIKL